MSTYFRCVQTIRWACRSGSVGVLFLLGACAVTPPILHPPSAIPGYVFGYKTFGHGPKSEIVSGDHQTWFVLPSHVKLLEAKGDGKNVSFKRKGAYWISSKVATRWTLYTSNGPVFAVAPKSVGIVLAAEHQRKADVAHYVWKQKTLTVAFAHDAILSNVASGALDHFVSLLRGAHKTGWIRVSGETTRNGGVANNARLGAARSSVVTGWLTAHGVIGVHNLGWTPGANNKAALVVARYQTLAAPPVQLPYVFLPIKVALRAQTSGPAHLAPKKPTSYVLTTHSGDLLSADLGRFLRHYGWSLVWQNRNDFALRYPARYTGSTLKATLRQVVQIYGVRVVLYNANHIAVIENGE